MRGLAAPDFEPAPGAVAAGLRVYAVGDVHGCARQLEAMHACIAADLASRPVTGRPVLVHLGDAIDRGPDSAAALAALAGSSPPVADPIVLMGNHEAMMLEALEAAASPGGEADGAVAHWLANGGDATLASWRLSPRAPETWADGVPRDALDFVRGMRLCHREGDYLFVHAGLRAGVPVDQQSAQDLLWMREPFLSTPESYGVVVVHGHTPREVPEVRPWRIGVDTGAVMGGALTCAVLEEDRVAFLRV